MVNVSVVMSIQQESKQNDLYMDVIEKMVAVINKDVSIITW